MNMYRLTLHFKAGLLTFERSLEFIDSAIKQYVPEAGHCQYYKPQVRFKPLLVCEKEKHCIYNAKAHLPSHACIQKDIMDSLPLDIRQKLDNIQKSVSEPFNSNVEVINAAEIKDEFECLQHGKGGIVYCLYIIFVPCIYIQYIFET